MKKKKLMNVLSIKDAKELNGGSVEQSLIGILLDVLKGRFIPKL